MTFEPVPLRRRGKEWRERVAALLLLVPAAPVMLVCALAIKLEALLDPRARGPVFFTEARISRGRVIPMLKFRTLPAAALAGLDRSKPTHIADLEQAGQLTRVGKLIRQWYLDELPQLLNIVKGDMFLIGTRPYPIEEYEAELAKGITRKRDMPAGLIGLVQSHKGKLDVLDEVELDRVYWDAFQTYSATRLLLLDLQIVMRSAKVQAEHKGL